MRKFIMIGTVIVTICSSSVLAAERLSLGYIYNASKSHIEIVETTKDSVNVVSPTCFDLNSRGRLEINDALISEEFVVEMHKKDIKVTPFLSNHWGRKRAQLALKNPEILISELVEAIELYDFDGINVDLENLTIKDKDSLTNFVKLLREALPKDKTLSVAVAANPKKLSSTWIAAYDYKGLAEHADYLVVMTYDEHCYGGTEGPVAGINFVEESLKVVLEQVSREKIVMGIPLYGRYWEVGEDVGGEAIVIGQVPRIINQYKIKAKYDEPSQTPYVTLNIKEGQKGPFVNGKYLDEGTYKIWYENEESIKAKLELVNKYNILGAGLWALDNESVEFWDYYDGYLNATPYESENDIRLRKDRERVQKLIEGKSFEMPKLIEDEVKYKELEKFVVELQKERNGKIQYDLLKNNYVVVISEMKKNKYTKIKGFELDVKMKLQRKSMIINKIISIIPIIQSRNLIAA